MMNLKTNKVYKRLRKGKATKEDQKNAAMQLEILFALLDWNEIKLKKIVEIAQ